MTQNDSAGEKDYERFIAQILESEEVWGLNSKDGWAYCASNEYEDTDVLPFWSDRSAAEKHVKGDWRAHKPEPISLDDFIDIWLRGMDEDGALVGPNWSNDLAGLEVEPGDVVEKLTEEEAT